MSLRPRRGRTAEPPAPARADDPVARYGSRFHRLIGGTHSVCSPFGAWLLIALVADAATGERRDRLADVLGCDPAEAADRARELLSDPHPALALGAAVWRDPALVSDGLDHLVAAIAPPAETGELPTQAQADAWASERTLGLIEQFPLDIPPDLVVLLATALATKVSWRQPFALARVDEVALPVADPRFGNIRLLRAPGEGHWQGIVDGRFAAHCTGSPDGLYVASVIGDPADDPAELLNVAQRVASQFAGGEPVSGATSLFDLPLGDGAAWRITEESGYGTRERFETLVAAWEATSAHDLTAHPALGFNDAGQAVIDLLPPDDYAVDAKQAAMARYTRLGFEAAAVTAIGVRQAGMAMPTAGPVRTARLEFTHPYAVVAATAGAGPWRGMPVFSAWVAEPISAE